MRGGEGGEGGGGHGDRPVHFPFCRGLPPPPTAAHCMRRRRVPRLFAITCDVYGRSVGRAAERRRAVARGTFRRGFKAGRVGGSRSVAGRASRWKDVGGGGAPRSTRQDVRCAAGRTIDRDTHGRFNMSMKVSAHRIGIPTYPSPLLPPLEGKGYSSPSDAVLGPSRHSRPRRTRTAFGRLCGSRRREINPSFAPPSRRKMRFPPAVFVGAIPARDAFIPSVDSRERRLVPRSARADQGSPDGIESLRSDTDLMQQPTNLWIEISFGSRAILRIYNW